MLVRTTGKMSTKTIYMDFKDGFLAMMHLGMIRLEVVIQEEEMIIAGAKVILAVAGFWRMGRSCTGGLGETGVVFCAVLAVCTVVFFSTGSGMFCTT